MKPFIVLVGPPGAGKTTVGELLAKRHDLPFRDTDSDVEAAAGKSISDIFIEEGESVFRELEREAVKKALVGYHGVLALGGGAVIATETRALLTGHRVVFLDVEVAAAADRVGFNRSRPLLAVNPRAELTRMLTKRRPLYEEVALVVVKTDDRTPEEVADAVVAALAAT